MPVSVGADSGLLPNQDKAVFDNLSGFDLIK